MSGLASRNSRIAPPEIKSVAVATLKESDVPTYGSDNEQHISLKACTDEKREGAVVLH